MNPLLSIRELASDVLVERLGWVLIHSLWQFTLIAFAAALVVRLLGRSRAAVRYAVLVGAMAAIVVSPMATWFLQPEGTAIAEVAPDVAEAPIATGAALAATSRSALDGDPADAALAVSLPSEELPARSASRAIPEVSVAAPTPLTWAESAERTLRPWLAWIVVGWSLGVVLCSLRPLLGWHALWRLRRVGVSPVGDEIAAALRRVAGQLGLRRVVQVLQSTLVQTPVLVGYFRPAILVPVGLVTGLPIAQLEAILAHELAHVRRHDFVVNLLQTLVETLCFYHPAVWWLSRQIRVEREHCCDDLVVGLLGNRVEYGRALLAVEELRGTSSVLALGMADGVLLSRVRRLFGGGGERVVDRWPAALLSLAGVGLILVLGLVWHRAAQDEDERPSKPAIATLPGDVAVELVGVGPHPAKDKPWWKPDGRPLEPRPTLEGGFSVMSGSPEQAQCREFLIHIRGLPREHAVTTDYGPVSAATGSSYSNGLWVGEHGAGPFKSDTTSVRVGLTTEPYGPTVEIDITGTRQPAELSADLQPFYDRIVPLRVEEVDGQTELILDGTASSNLFKEAAWELHAVDVDGEKHRRSSESVPPSGERHFAFKLPRNRIARFEYRVRPYRHWVTFENVSLEPGKKTDVKVSVETVQATADFPPPAPEEVRGLDLSQAAVRHYSEATRLSPEQQTPELLVPGSDPAEPWRRPKNVFLMPLAENIWLKYPAGSGHFYINHRPDGTWQHERMYGPIEGDPFELLKLEELFREQLKPGATGGDPRYRLTLMFRTGDPELIRRAWKLAEPELSATGVDEYFTEQDPQRYVRLEVLQRIREALRDEAEAFGRAELAELTALIRRTVAAAESAIDAVNDAVSDDQYEPVADLQSGIVGKIPDSLWGPPLDGLRLGLVPRRSIDWAEWQKLPADEEFPASITAQAGDELLYQLLVENVSDREITLCGYVVGEEMGRQLYVLDRSGRPVFVNGLHTSIPHFLSYWRLKPGERRLLPMPSVHLAQLSSDSDRKGLGYFVEVAPGEYTLRCRFRFGNLDNERHRYVPGKSEWIGELSTGAQTITIAAGGLGAVAKPVADSSVSLVDAVRDFNAENVQRGRGQHQPPLTEEEVVAAIQQSEWKRDAKDVSEREFAAFKAVAKTRRLPEGAKLEVLTGVQWDAFTTSRLWSIRLIMPALERAGTVGFSIRHTVLSEEKIDPQQVAWGRPDADGLSLGLFLSPRKAQYRLGERVQLRLFVRNEGTKAIDDLTFMNITWPVIEDFTVTDQTGARVAVRNGHEEWSGPQWIAGAIKSGLEAGDAYALRVPFEIGLGGEVDKLVGRILDAKPGQTLRLRVRAANGSERIRAADEPKPESGEVTLTVQTQTAAVDDAKNPSNRPAAPPRATLTGRFVYDGEAPPLKDLWPQFAEIDATQRQTPGPNGRFSGVEATYREFLKQSIRPSTLDPSLLVNETGGIANVVVWVTSKEIPWTPPADLAQRPVTIRLKDGNFAPRMTVATVGQPVVVENFDPVPFGIHATFQKNSDFNPLLRPGKDVEPFRWTGVAAEPFPAHYRCDQGPWADGWLFVAANSYVAVSGVDGTFTLPDLPPGEWEFRVWHERRGYLQHWPKGVFRQTIEPGQNELGVIRLKPELFAER